MFYKSLHLSNVTRWSFLWGPVRLIPRSVHIQNSAPIIQSHRQSQLLSDEILKDTSKKEEQLAFDNYKEVFNRKKFHELLRAVFIFRLCSFNWLLTHSHKILIQGERLLGRKLWSQLLKPTLYGQFVAGDNRMEIEKTVASLKSAKIGSLLGIPMEEDADDVQSDKSKWYEMNLEAILESIQLAYELDSKHPMVHAKGTALMPSKLIANIGQIFPEPTERPEIISHFANSMKNGNQVHIDGLDSWETKELQKGLERLRQIGESALEKGVIFMLDAEHTYVNGGLNLLTLAMMLNYNIHTPLIFFTYQSYLKASSKNLKNDLSFTDSHQVKFGAKIVRGAYMDQERNRATSHGYSDPVNETYEETSRRYQFNVNFMLKRIQKKGDNYRIFVATHNEESVKKSIAKLDELGIDRLGGRVFFGQIYGMGDHVTYALGNAKLLVYKSLPYGPVTETLVYLVRRMHENKSIMKGARRERLLIEQALKDRILPFQL